MFSARNLFDIKSYWSRTKKSPAAGPQKRRLTVEYLEARHLLSVSPAVPDTLHDAYPDLGLSPETDYNVIDIAAKDLSAAALRAAIAEAGTTTANDLIICRTSAEYNTITLGGEELSINIPAAEYGTVTIVSLAESQQGEEKLTLDAEKLSRVMSIGEGSVVRLEGLVITGGEFVDSAGSTGGGGGILSRGNLEIDQCIITGNAIITSGYYAGKGGGISAYGELTIRNSQVTNNEGLNHLDGGGIYHSAGNLTIINCVISDNYASSGGGGGVYSNPGSSNAITICESVFQDNVAEYWGGGLYRQSGGLHITNSVFAGNRSTYSGGGIYWGYTSAGTQAMINCTVAGNFALTNGGIDVSNSYSTSLQVQNSIIALNSSTSDLPNLTADSTNNIFGNPLFVNPPVFDSTGNLINSGSIDLRLASNSPAIDAGDNEYVQTAADVAGNTRIYNGTVDIGAYEFVGDTQPQAIPSTIVTTLDDTMDPDDGLWSLREAIYYAFPETTITFDDSLRGTIYLESQLTVDKPLVIDGDGRITLDGRNTTRIFYTTAGAELRNLAMQNGYAYYFITGEDYNGGGIYNKSDLTLRNCMITGCFAEQGGAIYSAAGNLMILQSTIAGNSALYSYQEWETGETVYYPQAGGIYGGNGSLEMHNSIVGLNYGSDIRSSYENSSYEAQVYLSENSGNNLIGNPLFVCGPMFKEYGLLANADELDLRLAANSPAIDAGNNAYLGGETDLNGNPRVYNGTVDIGVFEYHGDTAAQPQPATVVTTLDDSFDPDDGLLSLREALFYAKPGAEITFESGLEGTIFIDSQIHLDRPVSILGHSGITIDGQGKTNLFAVTSDVTIQNLRLTHGYSSYSGGAAVYNNGGNLTLVGCEIVDNAVANEYGSYDWYGAGVYNRGGLLEMYECVVAGNTGVWGGGVASIDGTLRVYDSNISNNTSDSLSGGGIFASNSDVTINGTVITGNQGSGISYFFSQTSNFSITDSVVAGNIGHNAGGIDFGEYSYLYSEPVIDNCTIVANIATAETGAGGIFGYGQANLTNSIVALNVKTSPASYSAHHSDLLCGYPTDGNNLFSNPLFVVGPEFACQWDAEAGNYVWTLTNAADLDLRLASNSPLRDADAVGAYAYDSASPANAENYTRVTTLGDTFDPSDGVLSLREALFYAPAGATITFDATLSGSILLERPLVVESGLTIDGGSRVTLDGQGQTRIMEILTSGRVELRNLTMINGNGKSDAEWNKDGGAICALAVGGLTIVNCALFANTAEGGGGAIASSNYGNWPALTIIQSTIAGNTSLSGTWGGVYWYGAQQIYNSVITANYGGDGDGFDEQYTNHNVIGQRVMFYSGPIFDEDGNLTNADTLDLRLLPGSRGMDAGSVEKAAQYGLSESSLDVAGTVRISGPGIDIGAYEYRETAPVYTTVVTTLDDSFDPDDGLTSLREAIHYALPGAVITFDAALAGSILLNNQLVVDKELSIDGDGRIVLDGQDNHRAILNTGALSLYNLTITNGHAWDVNPDFLPYMESGGGIYNYDAESLYMENCVVAGNRASYGGGIAGFDTEIVLVGCLLRDNFAGYSGGAVELFSGQAILVNNTIVNNTGGIYANCEATLINNIIVGNDDDITTDDGTVTGVNNITSFTGWGDDSRGNLSCDDPQTLFVDLAGGDYRLLPTSPAIDAGDTQTVAPYGLTETSLDLAGNRRVVNLSIDIGAYEYHRAEPAFANVVTTLDDTFNEHDGVWSLREAVYFAESGATITFDASLSGSILLDSQLFIDKNLTIDGDSRITLDGQDKTRVIFNTATLMLEGLVITRGYAETDSGGAIYNNWGDLTLVDCTVTACVTPYAGGGIFSYGGLTLINAGFYGNEAGLGGGGFAIIDGSVTAERLILDNNKARYGGGFYSMRGEFYILDATITNNTTTTDAGGISAVNSTIIIDNALVSGNTAPYGAGCYARGTEITFKNTQMTDNIATTFDGGGICTDYSNVIFENSIIHGNTAAFGGGVSASGGEYTFIDTVISENRLYEQGIIAYYGGKGGGIFANNYGDDSTTLRFVNSTVTGNGSSTANWQNSMDSYGGAAYFDGSATIIAENSSFSDNEAQYGGGIAVENGTLTITGLAISDNTGYEGGGIYNNAGNVTVTNSTISDNTASYGGGIVNELDGTITVIGSTIIGNTSVGPGGGVLSHNSTTNIIDSTISNNTATPNTGIDEPANSGGGIKVYGGVLNLSGSVIAGNITNAGAGIYAERCSLNISDTELNASGAGYGYIFYDVTLNLSGEILLNDWLTFGGDQDDSISFQGTQTISGTGTIEYYSSGLKFRGTSPEESMTLTLGEGITLIGTDTIGRTDGGELNIVNAGTITLKEDYWNYYNTLTINGNYTQTSTGVLNLRIGGEAVNQYDRLIIGGEAVFDGRINITRDGEYTPQGVAVSFRPVLYETGSASANIVFDGLDFGGYATLFPTWADKALVLTVGEQLGPRVLAVVPCGNTTIGETRPFFDVIFDQVIDAATLSADDFTILDAEGHPVAIYSIKKLGTKGDTWRVYLNLADAFNGRFDLEIGPAVNNLLHLSMNQNGLENSVFTATFTISLSDLAVSFPEDYPPTDAELGMPFDLAWIVENLGTADVLGSWTDRVYLSKDNRLDASDLLLASVSCGASTAYDMALGVGDSYEMLRRVTMPMDIATWTPGTYYLIVVTDAANKILEHTEVNNNIVSREITLVHPPLVDLEVSDVRCASGNILPGGKADIVWTTTNLGSRPTSGSWQETVYLSKDGTLANATKVYSTSYTPAYPLQAGYESELRRATITVPATGFEGEYYIIVRTDVNNVVVESDKTNNTAVSAATMMIPKTLALTFNSAATNVEKTSARVSEGQTISATLTRSGDLSQPLAVHLAVDNTASFSVPATVTIPAGKATVTFNISALTDGVVDGEQWGHITATAADAAFNVPQATISATDIDSPSLFLSATRDGQPLTEIDEGETFELTITRDFGLDKTLYVNLRQSSSKQFDLPGTVKFLPGEQSVTLIVTATADLTPEQDEWVTVSAVAAGYITGTTDIFVYDDDMPELSLSFSSPTVAEGAGSNALMGTISRAVATDEQLIIRLSSDRADKIMLPAEVIIPAGRTSVDFYLASLDNGIMDGTVAITVTALGVIPACDCSTPEINAGMTTGVLYVLDDDGPALGLRVEKAILREGEEIATYLTVSRNTADTSQTLEITLSASVAGKLSLPATITIPAGESTSARIPVGTLDDGISDGDVWVTITATADGFTLASSLVLVANTSAPDLIVSDITIQPEGYATGQSDITYTVRNQGVVAATGTWQEKIWISTTPNVTSASTLVGTYQRTGTLGDADGENEITRTVSVTLPGTVGIYWVIITVDSANSVQEMIETNNTAASRTQMAVKAPYVAMVATETEKADPDTPVIFTGYAMDVRDLVTPVADSEVDIYIRTTGGVRKVTAVTDADGNFEYVWTPLKGEAGTYEIGAAYPGSRGAWAVQDSFSLMKMITSVKNGNFHIGETETVTGNFKIHNIADVPLTGLRYEVVGQASNLDVQLYFSDVVAGNSSIDVYVTVTALSADIPLSGATLRLFSNETNPVDISLAFQIYPAQANLTSLTTRLDEFMIPGQQRIIEFEVTNEAAVATGPVELLLPDAPWLTSLVGNTLPSLAPGETRTVQLLLNPAPDMQLTQFDGILGLAYANTGLNMPFTFQAIMPQDAVGDIALKAVDEYYYYSDIKTGLIGASVTITDSITREVVSQGVTDASGDILIRDLPAGYYDIKITAHKHDDYLATILLTPGKTLARTAYMPYQAVTYEWTAMHTTIEDQYEIVVEAKFETNVPAPVVIMEPSSIDLSDLTEIGQRKQIDLTFTNHGLIAAHDVGIYFDDHPDFNIIKLVDKIDTLSAKTSQTITIIVERISPEEAMPEVGAEAASQEDGGVNGVVFGGGGEQLLKPSDRIALNEAYTQVFQASSGNITICQMTGHYKYSWVCQGSQWVYTPVLFIPSGDVVCKTYPTFPSGPSFIPGNIPSGFLWGLGPSTLSPPSSITVKYPEIKISDRCPTCVEAIREAKLEAVDFFVSGFGCFKDSVEFLITKDLFDLVGAVIECAFKGTIGKVKDFIDVGWATIKALKACLAEYEHRSQDSTTWELIHEFYLPVLAELQTFPVSWLTTSVSKLLSSLDKLWSAYKWYDYLYGDPAWLYCEKGEDFDNLTQTFWTHAKNGIISEDTKVELLAMSRPKGITESNVLSLIERWNRTVERSGASFQMTTTSIESETENYIDLDYLAELIQLSIDVENQVILDGYDNVLALMLESYQEFYTTVTQQADNGVCASVSLQLNQTAVLTRDVFAAQLTLNSGASPLSNVGVDIIITDAMGNDVTHLFGIKDPVTSGFFVMDDTPDGCVGDLSANATGVSNWIFMPATELAKNGPEVYYVGGFLRYEENGRAVSIPMTAVGITVLPQPELDLIYFWQRDVLADDPWTEEIEPSQPFELVVMVINNGEGTARQMRIESAQPKIVDNEKGLLIDFAIIGSQVNGKDASPSLTINFGDIAPGEIVVGQWFMTSTLQGQFTEYDAKFRHVNGFNDLQFSLIKSVEIHELIRTVSADADGLPDMLVNDKDDLFDIPDALYLSDGTVQDVSYTSGGTLSGGAFSSDGYCVTVAAEMAGGWAYLRLADTQIDSGKYRLSRVVRSDGTEIDPANFWQSDRTFIRGDLQPLREENIHLLDFNSTGEYTLYFEVTAGEPLGVQTMQQVAGGLTETPVTELVVEFNREIAPDSFKWQDLTLTRGQSGNLLNANITIEHLGGAAYKIIGLAEFTKADGEYALALNASGIQDADGVSGTGFAFARWIKAADAPVVMAVDNAPAAFGNEAVSSVTVHLSRPIDVSSFDREALILTRDGGSENLIGDSVTVTQISETSWQITGLETMTAADGAYALTILAQGLFSQQGVAGLGSETLAWTKDSTGPTQAEWLGRSREYTNYAYNAMSLVFPEMIDPAAFPPDAITLTRDGVPVPLDERLTLEILESGMQSQTWQLAGLSDFTTADGVYVLCVDLSRLSDLSGNAGSGTASVSWVMDTAPIGLLPEAFTHANSAAVTLRGVFSKENLQVTVFDQTSGQTLAATYLADTDVLDCDVLLPSEGIHDLLIRVTDRAGNRADFYQTVQVDLTAPFVLDVTLEETLAGDALGGMLHIRFSESAGIPAMIAEGAITEAVKILLPGDRILTVPVSHFSYDPQHMQLSITLDGLEISVPPEGLRVQVQLDGAQFRDAAGNMLRGSRDDAAAVATPVFGEARYVLTPTTMAFAAAYSAPAYADFNGDGLPDLIVGEKAADGRGYVRVYLNSGTPAAPVFTDFAYAMCGAEPLSVDGGTCQGAYPRLVDWDGDGKNDLLVGLADGRIMVFLNDGTVAGPTFAAPFFVQVGTGESHVDLDVGNRAAFDVADWNNDGKFDLVVGGMDGKIRVYLNSGTAQQPLFASQTFIQLGGEDLVVESGRASVAVVDLDGDGRKDLIVGNTNGQALFYRNVGTDAQPVFSEAHALESAGSAIDLDGSPRSRPFVADFNDDGIPDLLVGAADGYLRVYYGIHTPVFSADGDPGAMFVASMNITHSGSLALPDVPANLAVAETGLTSITLTWDAAANAERYLVQQYAGTGDLSAAANWFTVTDTLITDTTYTISGLTAGETYRFRVVAGNATGFSNASEAVEAATCPPVTVVVRSTLSDPAATAIPPGETAVHEWQRFRGELWTQTPLEDGTEILLAYDATLFVPVMVGDTVQHSAPAGITLAFAAAGLDELTGLTELRVTIHFDPAFTWPETAAATLLGAIEFAPAETVGSGVPASEIRRSAAEHDWLLVAKQNVTTDVLAVPYDLDNNDVINIYDLISFAKLYGREPASDPLAAQADFNSNGIVDIYDLIQFAKNYGKSKGGGSEVIMPTPVTTLDASPIVEVVLEMPGEMPDEMPDEMPGEMPGSDTAFVVAQPADTELIPAAQEIALPATTDTTPAVAEAGIIFTETITATPQLPETVVVERPVELPAVPALPLVTPVSASALPAALAADAVLSRMLPEIAGKFAFDQALLDLYDGPDDALPLPTLQPQPVAASDAVFEDDYDWNEAGDEAADGNFGDDGFVLAMLE